ncbi:4-hydroxy-tetrahydrodipicolinate synthase [Candidatus Bipolaricaulota bacterium]|nr:4-hydroxy-tetrahydrodipicolinate synthase [Candidatus Bipolaricaulota bacterium]
MAKFEGIIPPVITVFDSEENVDIEKTLEFIDHLIEEGVHGIFVAGSTGEYTLMDNSERKELIKEAVNVTKDRLPLLAGTAANDTKTAIELSQFAESVGAAAATVALPHYPKPSQAGLYEHYKQIADNISIPLLAYNWPGQHAGLNIEPETVKRLVEEDIIAGIKDSSDLQWGIGHLAEVKRLTGDKISVLTGFANQLLPALSLGACGSVCTIGNIIPRKIVSIYENFQKGNYKKAKKIQLEILPIINMLEVDPGTVKMALKLLGHEVGSFRSPIIEPSDEAKQEIKGILQSQGLLEQ